MKILTTLALFLAINTYALQSTQAKEASFHCMSNKEKLLVVESIANTWKVDLFFKDKKIGSCPLTLTNISDPREQQATKEIEFEVGACQYQFDKLKTEFSLVSKGFLKINEKQKRASGLLLNNSQPLFCKIKS